MKNKINLWDRIFNRYRKEIVERKTDICQIFNTNSGQVIPNSRYEREYVLYKITDLVTGSEKLKKEYLN